MQVRFSVGLLGEYVLKAQRAYMPMLGGRYVGHSHGFRRL